MKKILAIFICALVICTFSIVAFAEGDVGVSAEESITEEEIVTEGKNLATESTETPPVIDDSNDLTVDEIVDYVKAHAEEISVILSIIISAIYSMKRNKKTYSSIATVNNNAVTIAENSKVSMESMASVVAQYKDEMASAIVEVRRNAEERAKLEASLAEVSTYLKATRLANTELANEVAELLVLANIPNSKKDELYARHLAAVNAIKEAENVGAEDTEVKENDSENET